MSEQEKKRERKNGLLNAKIKPKKFSEINGVSLWPPSSPVLNPHDQAISGVLESKTNETSHPYIALLKITIEEK